MKGANVIHRHIREKGPDGALIKVHGVYALDNGSAAPVIAGLMARARARRTGGTAVKITRSYWIVEHDAAGAIFEAASCVDQTCTAAE